MSLDDLLSRGKKSFNAFARKAKHAATGVAASLALGSALLFPSLSEATRAVPEQKTTVVSPYQVTEQGEGKFPNLMLHIYEEEGCGIDRFTICYDDLKDLATRMTNEGYVAVPNSSVHDGTMITYLEPGERPYVISIDDGEESVIKFLKRPDGTLLRNNDGTPKLDTNCFLSAMRRLSNEVEGFDYSMILYLNFIDGETFGGSHMKEKFAMLAADPRIEFGYHTVNHESMRHKNAHWATQDIAHWDLMFTELSGLDAQSTVRSAAWPFGHWPQNPEVMRLIKERFDDANDAYGGLAASKNSAAYDQYRNKRIEVHTKAEFGQPDTIEWALTLPNQYLAQKHIALAENSRSNMVEHPAETAQPATTWVDNIVVAEQRETASQAPEEPSPAYTERQHSPFSSPTNISSFAIALIAGTSVLYQQAKKLGRRLYNGEEPTSSPPLHAVAQTDMVEPAAASHDQNPVTEILPVEVIEQVVENSMAADSLDTVLEDIAEATHTRIEATAARTIARSYLESFEKSIEQDVAAEPADTSIDALAERAVKIYNCHASSTPTQRYKAIKEEIGLEDESQAIGLLQAHVASSYVSAPREQLAMHEHRAIIDAAGYDKELAEAYVTQTNKSTAALAEEYGAKRGMRMSRSTFERRAKQYINKTFSPDSTVRSRSEAKAVVEEARAAE
jgi:hypothetical protein